MLPLLLPVLLRRALGVVSDDVCSTGNLAEWADDGRSFNFCLNPSKPLVFGFAGSFNVSTCPEANLATYNSNADSSSTCWWDTSYESRCMSGVCIWDSQHWNRQSGGACFCKQYDAETAGAPCNACVDPETGEELTPAPTYDISDSPCEENCQIYDLGCGNQYCMCGDAQRKCEATCDAPVNPRCWLWGPGGPPPPSHRPTPGPTDEPTPRPTYAPTSDKTVMWEIKLCCLTESQVEASAASVATGLKLEPSRVRVNKKIRTGRRRDIADEKAYSTWEIQYAIEAETMEEAAEIMDELETADEAMEQRVEDDLQVQLTSFFTVAIRKTELVPVSTTEPSQDGADDILKLPVILGIVAGVFLLGLCACRDKIKRKCCSSKVQKELLTGIYNGNASPSPPSLDTTEYAQIAQTDHLDVDTSGRGRLGRTTGHMRVVN